jgi:hypothetical protein
MRTVNVALRLIALGAMVSMVAACGSQSLAPAFGSNAAGSSSFEDLNHPANAKAAPSYVYTCQSETSDVDCLVYASNKIVLTLTQKLSKPLGVAAGADGRFYIADESAEHVLVYSAGAKKLLATLDDGGNAPVDVAVYQDEVVAANERNLTVFAPGATKPTRTLQDSGAVKGTGAAFDAKGNCYWSFVNKSSKAQVDEFKGCKGSGKSLEIGAGSPYGIAFDGKDNLWYTSYSSSADGVYECSGLSSCARVLTAIAFVDPQYLNFAKGFADLWVEDPGNYQNGSALYEIDVASAKVVDKVTAGISFFNPPTGVAAGPGSQ